jgi:hypothetical protein
VLEHWVTGRAYGRGGCWDGREASERTSAALVAVKISIQDVADNLRVSILPYK